MNAFPKEKQCFLGTKGAGQCAGMGYVSQEVIEMIEMVRVDIKPGMRVQVVQKQDQRSGKLTEGIVKDVLTKSATHPHGIKVRLESGIVGRVKKFGL